MLYRFVLTCEVEGPWKCSSLKPKDEKGYSPLDSSFEEMVCKVSNIGFASPWFVLEDYNVTATKKQIFFVSIHNP